MSVFDILKSKKALTKTESKKMVKKPKQDLDEILKPKDQTIPSESKPAFAKASAGKHIEKKQFSDAYKILDFPHVTEKAGMLAEKNSYVFRVAAMANKYEIKKAVQDLYGVRVERVNIVNIPRKARRVGRSEGFKPGFKKAMVKLVAGEKIEIMPR